VGPSSAQEQVGVGDVPPAPRFPHGGSFGPSLAVVPQRGGPVAGWRSFSAIPNRPPLYRAPSFLPVRR
jgi:hypothetical protein